MSGLGPAATGSSAATRRGSGARKDLWIFGAVFVGVWFLWSTPVVYPLKVLVVLLHEISHGLAAILTGGSIVAIEVNANQGGLCLTRGGSRFLTLSAGYLGSMLFGAAVLLVAARTRYDRKLALGLGVFLGVVTLFKVRPLFSFGFNFGAITAVVLVLVATRLPNEVSDILLKVVGTTSCLYAILDIKSDILDRPHLQSDARMLAEHTGIPTVIWGIVWIGVAGYVTFRTFLLATRGEGPK